VTIIVNPNSDSGKDIVSDVETKGEIDDSIRSPESTNTVKEHLDQYELKDSSDSAPATVFEESSSDTASLH